MLHPILRSPIVKRSVVIAGHKTSISLEEPFWICVRDIARAQDLTVQQIVAKIDSERKQGNLSSAVRLFVLEHYRSRAKTIGAIATAPAQQP